MYVTKMGKLCIKVRQVNENIRLYTLWLIKYFVRAGANQLLVACQLLQRCKICNDKNDIVRDTKVAILC